MPGFTSIDQIEEYEKTPLSERFDYQSTWEVFERAEKEFGDLPALDYLFFGKKGEAAHNYSFRELTGKIRQCANLLYSLGVDENNPVSFLLPNLPETHFTLWGGELAGVVNPINVLLEPEHIASIMKAANSKVLVTLPAFPKTDIWQKVQEVVASVPSLKTILLVDMAAYLPFFQRMMVRALFRSGPVGSVQVLDFHSELREQPSDRLVFDREITPETTASLFHTGGTTGTPKLARHTHKNELFDAWVLGEVAPIDRGGVGLCALPLFHVNACIVTGLAAFIRGAKIVLMTPGGYRSPDVIPNFWDHLERFQVEFFSAVPTVFSSLLKYPIQGQDLSSLKFAITGAAPMPPDIFRRFEKLTGLRIIEGYGQTEGTCASSCNPVLGESRIGSIGLRFPYQGMKVAILDEEGKFVRDCQINEIGTVLIQGPNVFPGYTDESKNEAIWADGKPGEGWLNTGDLGRMDVDGYFWLTGRAKDMIIRGGHNIDPAMIEAAITEMSEVELVAAVGQPDSHAGEVPVAFVQLKTEARGKVSEEQVREFAKSNVPERAAVPVRVEFVEEIPLTPVGKIFKPSLRHKAIHKVYSQELNELNASFQILVFEDEKMGTLAQIELHKGDEEKIKEALSCYTVPFRLKKSSQ